MLTETADWYDTPLYYDIIFDQDTAKEAEFLEAVAVKHGGLKPGRKLRLLEPACGSGRLVAAMVERGHEVSGFDLNANMLDYARKRLTKKQRATLWQDRLESFTAPTKQPFEFAHCLVSTFKYVLEETGAVSHLQHVAAALEEGALYVLGVHLTDYTHERAQHERWVADRDGIQVVCNTHSWPPDRKARTEDIRTRLRITREGRTWLQETRWQFRTYSAGEMKRLLNRVPELELVECYDFTYDITAPRAFDDSYEDIVLVLRKRGQ